MSPLIVRRTGPSAVAARLPGPQPVDLTRPARWLDDLRLFATGWVGGLIFFGTLIG